MQIYLHRIGWTEEDLRRELNLRGPKIDRCFHGELPFPKLIVGCLRTLCRNKFYEERRRDAKLR